MPLNSLYPRGTHSEQTLVEDLVAESIRMFGAEWFYIPRVLVAKDDILGEDNLSRFKHAYMVECYLDNIDNFGGQGSFISKFGLTIEEQAQLCISKRRWQQLVGQFGNTIIPDRPCEGDLMYFPLNDGIFEIKFVEHQSPFYQLNNLPMYRLKIELFQYSSERIDTEIDDINRIALEMSFDILGDDPAVKQPDVRDTRQNTHFINEGNDILNFDENNPFGD